MGGQYDNTERCFNLTVVRYPINSKEFNLPGIKPVNCGLNRAIQSAHTGGAQVAMVDGSVHFLAENTELQVLFNLANRDDGNPVPGF